MDLCNSCSELTEWMTSPDLGDYIREFDRKATQATCPFCEQIIGRFQLSVPQEELNLQNGSPRLFVVREQSNMRGERGLLGQVEVFDARSGAFSWSLRYALWADPGMDMTSVSSNSLVDTRK